MFHTVHLPVGKTPNIHGPLPIVQVRFRAYRRVWNIGSEAKTGNFVTTYYCNCGNIIFEALKKMQPNQEKLLKKLRERRVMKVAELAPYLSNRLQLTRMADAGKLIPLRAGFYAHPSIDPLVGGRQKCANFGPMLCHSGHGQLMAG